MGKRILYSILTFFLVTILLFAVFQLIPGSPVLNRLGLEPDPALEAALRSEYHLDDPLLGRYCSWLWDLFHLDMGRSLRYDLPVNQLLLQRLPNTIGLALFAFAFVLLLGIPLGVLAAKLSKGKRGAVFNGFCQLGVALPSFFVAMLLILLFCLKLKWLPVNCFVSLNKGLFPFLRGLLLPALAVAFSGISTTARYVRSSVLEEMGKDYVLTARNKGVKEGVILRSHILRNAMIPVVTILGMIFVSIITGSIVVEQVFSIPGIGMLLVSGIQSLDIVLVQGICVYISLVVIVAYLLLDLLYMAIDPRIRIQE